MRFGLDDGRIKTLGEIAARMRQFPKQKTALSQSTGSILFSPYGHAKDPYRSYINYFQLALDCL
jgi:hypothetical protein